MDMVDVRSGVGLAMQMPGGLYEFVVLPIWLITRGFRAPARNTAEGLPMEPAPVLS